MYIWNSFKRAADVTFQLLLVDKYEMIQILYTKTTHILQCMRQLKVGAALVRLYGSWLAHG